MEASVRAILFYIFLVLVVRIVGRRPGKQITALNCPGVLHGGLALTAMVGDDASLTNAFVQVLTLALTHYLIALARTATGAPTRSAK